MIEKLSPDELKDFVTLTRNVEWQYRLDQFTDESLLRLQSAIDQTGKELQGYVRRRGRNITDWSKQRVKEITNEMDTLTVGVRSQTAAGISEIATEAGLAALKEHASILSFKGAIAVNSVSLSSNQLLSLVQNTPLGGTFSGTTRTLQDWVDNMFTTTMQNDIKKEMTVGMLRGEGYKKLSNRVRSTFSKVTKREAITLTRSYVQSANVGAQKAVYKANPDVVKGVKWSSILESGYKKTGRGTCVRCAVLDGEIFGTEDSLYDYPPPCPLHPRCRCNLLPVTKTWKELGLPLDEIKSQARHYVKRTNVNIDAGRSYKQTAYEKGVVKGNYKEFFEGQSKVFQKNAVGKVRQSLIARNQLEFKDLVDKKTGKLFSLNELGFTITGKRL